MFPSSLRKYLHTRAVSGPWTLQGCTERSFGGAVVIPALAEEEHLFATLESLGAQPEEILARFLVVVVVNHRAEAEQSEKENNRRTLERLAAGDVPDGLRMAWVDAAAPGAELPSREGVGLARKIGCDLALERLAWNGSAPLLGFLDADTLVGPDYLPAIVRHFSKTREGGAVLPFAHQEGETPAQQEAIVRYELFLRSYVLGLSLAGSPYAFHTVGSTIACRADAYVGAGGMNRRLAGEDFYFLQQLAKTAGVAPLAGTLVRPSPRPSTRTPFGTGRAIARQLSGESPVAFYHPEVFRILGQWRERAAACLEADGPALLRRAGSIHPQVALFLQAEGFSAAWERVRRTFPDRERLFRAFEVWFDGLKTLRLIHRLSASAYPRCGPEEGLSRLLARAGLSDPGGNEERLEVLRRLQNSAD